MEWEKTVMALADDVLTRRPFRELLNEQAEISYKAGIKEVVDWLGKSCACFKKEDGKYLVGDWQAKLKEWGVE